AGGWRRTLGLRSDGTVLAAGRRNEGACDVTGWREVVTVSCGDWHAVGVRADGTAVATGANRRGSASSLDGPTSRPLRPATCTPSL
ncbi:MAG: RCC1 domain-containing protein, partial [Intrasporangium sp.]